MSEKMREDFFEWYYQQEQFGDAHQEELWKAWQASRAALVVELPELKSFNASDEPDFAYEVAIDDIKCSLDDAGVGYK